MKDFNFSKLLSLSAGEVEQGEAPDKIELLQTGEWDTPSHGFFQIGKEDLEEYVRNFDNGVRKGDRVPIDIEHNTTGGAAAWITELTIESNSFGGLSLWGSIEWTKRGKQLVEEKEFIYFSPEFATLHEDPEQIGKFINNVLIGGGLTNRPLFKNLTTVSAKDNNTKHNGDNQKNVIYLTEENQMKLETIVTKEAKDLSEQEQEFLRNHSDELTDDQKSTFASVLEAKETEAEKKAREAKEVKEAADAEAKIEADKKEAAEKAKNGKKVVTVTAAELEQMKSDAGAGRLAIEKLEASEAAEHIKTTAFNEKEGVKLPVAMMSEVSEFYTSLNEDQKTAFDGIVEKLPTSELFGENGADHGSDAPAYTEIKERAEKLIAKAKEADKKLTLAEAFKQVRASDKDLAAKYDKETQGEM